jgi:hypothetical protein
MQEKLKSILNNLNDRYQFLRSSTIDLSSIKELYSFYSDELTQVLKSSTLSNSQPAIEKISLEDVDNGDNEDEYDEIPYFPPYYNGKIRKLVHFNQYDALLTFLMFGYDLKKIKFLDEEFYALLNYEKEKIYLHTEPDIILLELRSGNEVEKLEIDGFYTKVLYKLPGMKKAKVLELYEINNIFNEWMKSYLEYLKYLMQLEEELFKKRYSMYIV